MAREVDRRKTRKALRKLKRAAERAEAANGPGLTDWEKDFVSGVTERLETYGSAFRDPAKGRLDEALSARQTAVSRALDRKSRKGGGAEDAEGRQPAKPSLRRGSGFKPKPKPSRARVRDINEDAPEKAPDDSPPRTAGRPRLRLISGSGA